MCALEQRPPERLAAEAIEPHRNFSVGEHYKIRQTEFLFEDGIPRRGTAGLWARGPPGRLQYHVHLVPGLLRYEGRHLPVGWRRTPPPWRRQGPRREYSIDGTGCGRGRNQLEKKGEEMGEISPKLWLTTSVPGRRKRMLRLRGYHLATDTKNQAFANLRGCFDTSNASIG